MYSMQEEKQSISDSTAGRAGYSPSPIIQASGSKTIQSSYPTTNNFNNSHQQPARPLPQPSQHAYEQVNKLLNAYNVPENQHKLLPMPVNNNQVFSRTKPIQNGPLILHSIASQTETQQSTQGTVTDIDSVQWTTLMNMQQQQQQQYEQELQRKVTAVNTLTQQQVDHERLIESLQQQIQQLNGTSVLSTHSSHQQLQRLGDAELQIQSLQQQTQQSQQQLTGMTNKAKLYESTLLQIHRQQERAVKACMKECEIKLEAMNSKLRALEETYARWRELHLKTQADNQELQAYKVQAEQQLKEYADMKQQFENLQSLHEQLQKQHTDLQASNTTLNEQHRKLTADHTKLNAEHQKMLSELKTALDKIAQQESSCCAKCCIM